MSGTFSPIPNFSGVGAGQQFRNAINNALGGTVPIAPAINGGTLTGGAASGTDISQAVVAAAITGAAARTLAARSADRITFSDYAGADPSGSSDNSALIARALADARARKKGLYFPAGRWGYALPTLVEQGDVVFGDGPGTQFVYVGATGSSGDERLFMTPDMTGSIATPTSGDPTLFANFRVTGPWNGGSVTTQITTSLIQLEGLWDVELRDLLGEYACNVGFMAAFCWSVRVSGCTLRYCARDAIMVSGSQFVQVVQNRIEHCDDNAITMPANTGQAWGIASNAVVALNTIVDTPGPSLQGVKRAVIRSNVIERPRQVGIQVTFTGANPQEGETPPIAVEITGNVITDVINRANIDGLDDEANYISVGTVAPQAGTAASIPGDPAATSGAVALPYPYFNVQKGNGTDTVTPIPASWHVMVADNICMRTIDPGASGIAYTSLGYGQMFTRNGWLNPTLDATALLQANPDISHEGVHRGSESAKVLLQ